MEKKFCFCIPLLTPVQSLPPQSLCNYGSKVPRWVRKKSSTPVESIRHKDKRANIPTEELRDFVADDEHAPKAMLYPRDPSLDPQLVWKGEGRAGRQPAGSTGRTG